MQPITLHASDLKELVEPHFHNELKDGAYTVRITEPATLLTYNRLDIAFKLLYLEYIDVCEKLATQIYTDHIHALTLGKYVEPGSPEKDSLAKFVFELRRIHESIAQDGFDQSKSLIPIASDGSILNGAHRLASAIHQDKPVACVEINSAPHLYDYQFFYSRNVPQAHIEMAVSKYMETASNVYVALIWPSSTGLDEEIKESIPNIVYRKEVKLNPVGARNLLIKVYHSEPWLGGIDNDFKGVEGKLIECFKNFNPLRVVAFQADTLEKVFEIKNKIRALFNIGKHSIHITDTKDEAIRVSRLLFNENSIHFLNHADPYKYVSNKDALKKLEEWVDEAAINHNDILVDGSLLFSLYGIRESKDVDYLSLLDIPHPAPSDTNSHEEDLEYHGQDKASLILNPLYHFYYDDLKIISFEQLYHMKKNRAGEKDLNDLKLMDALIKHDVIGMMFGRIKQHSYYLKVKLKIRLIGLLKHMRCYDLAKALYYKIQKR